MDKGNIKKFFSRGKGSKKRQDEKSPESKSEELGGLLKRSWKTLGENGNWTKQYEEKLISDIAEHDLKETELQYINILLVGDINAGKSSFLNSISSIEKGRMSQIACAGADKCSVTSALKEYIPKRRLRNFRIYDIMGLEDYGQSGLNMTDVLHVIKGHVRPGYKFNPVSPIDETSSEFIQYPKSNDRMHCVVFVADANIFGQDNISDKARQNINTLQDELRSLELPRIVLLTKIDVLCKLVEDDIATIYQSARIKEAVHRAQEMYKVPEQNIFPVKNYHDETDLDPKKNILLLLALRQMIFFATDFHIDKTAPKSDARTSTVYERKKSI